MKERSYGKCPFKVLPPTLQGLGSSVDVHMAGIGHSSKGARKNNGILQTRSRPGTNELALPPTSTALMAFGVLAFVVLIFVVLYIALLFTIQFY